MNGAAVGKVSSVPVLLSRIVSASSRRVSWTAVTWLCGATVMLAARATGRSIRGVTKPLPALV